MGLETVNASNATNETMNEESLRNKQHTHVDLRQLRDELNLQKGAYNESVKNNQNAVNELIELLQEFGQDQRRLLVEFNIDTTFISSINFERLTIDEEYLNSVIEYFNHIVDVLEEDLCKNLGIKMGD